VSLVRSGIEAQRKTADLTRRKVEAGLARRIDQLRAEAQLDAIEASVPALRAAIRASTWRLGVLTGRRPEEMADEVASAGTLPAAPEAPPIGMRADVLRRRPDVAVAERQLAAATAEVGIAKAEFFPRLQLSGNVGFESSDFSDLGTDRSRTSAVVPFVSWPIFQGGRLRANLEGADARARVAALSYEKTVLTALADAESAISAYAEELQTYENLTAAADASSEAAELAQKLYEKGLTDFLTVLDAERRRDENEDARAQSHTRLLLTLSRVYKSLGGGWAMEPGRNASK
jgi:multidrug efflux system outer membrane protein